MTASTTFDRWVDRGPFTARDLGIFRIVFAGSGLLLLPRPEAMSDLPGYLWNPPPGPLALLDAPPPHAVLAALSVVEALALAFLLVGVFTRTASIVAGATYLAADGFTNGYGTIYHYVLLGVVPIVLSFADWGRELSADARRRPRAAAPVPQWPLRLLALCIAVAFATAGLAKLRAGWLDPATQSTRAYFSNAHLGPGDEPLLGPLVGRVQHRAAWETLDWATVAMEIGLLAAVLSWAAFRRYLLVVVAFHLSVLLVLGIAFAANVVAYGAFVRWSTHVPRPPVPELPHGAWPMVGAVLAAAAAGLAVTGALTPAADLVLKAAFVVGAAVAAVVALVLCVRPRRPTPTSG